MDHNNLKIDTIDDTIVNVSKRFKSTHNEKENSIQESIENNSSPAKHSLIDEQHVSKSNITRTIIIPPTTKDLLMKDCQYSNGVGKPQQQQQQHHHQIVNDTFAEGIGRPIRKTNTLKNYSDVVILDEGTESQHKCIESDIHKEQHQQQHKQPAQRKPLSLMKGNQVNVNSCAENNRSMIATMVGEETTSTTECKMDIITEENFFLYKFLTIGETNTQENYFNKLSDEIILSIFKCLPYKMLLRCSQICRRFYNIVQDESLWTRLDMGKKCINAGGVGHILTKGIVILRLAQSRIKSPIFDVLTPGYICKLQYLDLSMCSISMVALQQLLSVCRQLKKLSLENVPINEAICYEISQNEQIETLHLAMCEGITSVDSVKLLCKLKLLQSLNISWTRMSTECLIAFVENAPASLLRLNIAGFRQQMSDACISKLVISCPELQELDVSDCSRITGDIITILSELKHLKYLSMSRCYSIAVATFFTINDTLQLQHLDIFGMVADHCIKTIQERYPKVGINKFINSSVARPTVGARRTSIWGIRTRDY